MGKKLLVTLVLVTLFANSFAVEFVENFKVTMGNLTQANQGVSYSITEAGTIPSGTINLASNQTTQIQIPANEQNSTPLFINNKSTLSGSTQQAIIINPNFTDKSIDITGPMNNLVTAKLGALHQIEKNGVVVENIQDIDVSIATPSGSINNNNVAVMIPSKSIFSAQFMYSQVQSGHQFTNVPSVAGLKVYVGNTLIYIGNVYFNAVYDVNSQNNISGYNYANPPLPNGFVVNPIVPSGTTKVLTYIDLPPSI